MLAITKENFDNEVIKSSVPVLIDFWAEWCGPCRMLAPTVEAISTDRTDIKVVKINVDEEGELAVKFGIDSIPTLVIVKNGEAVARQVGYNARAIVEAFINKSI